MGEAHKVTLSDGETGPLAEGAEEVKTTYADEHSVSIPTDQEGVEDAPVDRPDWLPEKFKTPEDFAEGYSELEKRLGGDFEPGNAEESEEIVDGSDGVDGINLRPFYDEYDETGGLTDASFEKLGGMGMSRDVVESFMEGQKAIQEREGQRIFNAVGGEETYKKALTWAENNMSEGELRAFNTQMEERDIDTAMSAAKGLVAQYERGTGSGLLKSEAKGPGGVAPYESTEQLTNDMRSKEYKNDPAFRAKVHRRLDMSKNLM